MAIDYYYGDIFNYALSDPVIPSNTILFDKEILEIVGYQKTSYRLAQDYEFVARICKHFEIAFLDIPTYVLTFHKGQATAYFESPKMTKQELLCDIETMQVMLNTVVILGLNDQEITETIKRKLTTPSHGLTFLSARVG